MPHPLRTAIRADVSPAFRTPAVLLAAAFVWSTAATASAQLYEVRPPRTKNSAANRFQSVPQNNPNNQAQPQNNTKPTDVSFELLLGAGGAGLEAQQWGRTFEEVGVPMRTRRAFADDKPELKERNLGPIRQVVVIGRLERSGTLVFPGRLFTPADVAKLSDWIRELQTYGAQGAPEGKPVWGLNEEQFGKLYEALSQPIEIELQDLKLPEAIAKLQIPTEYPVRISAHAAERLKRRSSNLQVRQPLEGFAKATALAVLLNDYGLGFRPLRTPDGSLELLVEPLDRLSEPWPIGWRFEGSRQETAPKLFALVPIDLKDVPLKDVLDGIAAASEVPVLVDYYRIEAKGIDISKEKVSYRPRQTSWSILLKGVTAPLKLGREIVRDERGRIFVWVTTLDPNRPLR